MKRELEVGDMVKILDHVGLSETQRKYVGKKGVVINLNRNPFIRFSKNKSWPFHPRYLKPCKPKQPKLLPFNLDEALAGKAVVTRDGREVVAINQISASYRPNTIRVEIKDGASLVYADNGRRKPVKKSPLDLFMKPEPKKKKTYWVNVYEGLGELYTRRFYESKQEALDNNGGEDFIKTTKIKL